MTAVIAQTILFGDTTVTVSCPATPASSARRRRRARARPAPAPDEAQAVRDALTTRSEATHPEPPMRGHRVR
jgi:hypothetical protein